MYHENIYKGIVHIEHDFFFQGEYGGKGEKRTTRSKPTPEQVARWNLKKKIDSTRHLIQLNFMSERDYWVTLKYPKGDRPGALTVKKNYAAFRRYLRAEYKRRGLPQKYIYRMEIGKRGGIHLHAVMNSITGDMREDICIMSLCWQKARARTDVEDMIAEDSTELPKLVVIDGRVDVDLLRTEGGYAQLAEYLCKPLPGDVEKELTREEIKELKMVGSSRNLLRVEPERKRYAHWTMRKLLEAGPERVNTDPALRKRYLTPGCIIDKSSWETGINPVTGMSYLHYLEIRVSRDEKDKHIHTQRHKEHQTDRGAGRVHVRVDEAGWNPWDYGEGM